MTGIRKGEFSLDFVRDEKTGDYSGCARYVLGFNACPVVSEGSSEDAPRLVFHTMLLSDVEQLKLDLEYHLCNVSHLLELCKLNGVKG